MFKIPDTIAPYAALIKWALIGIILSAVFISGCNHGKNKSAEKLAKKDATITAITKSLKGAANVLKEINAEAERRIAAEKKAKRAAEKAGAVVAAEKQQMQKRIDSYEKKLKSAKRKPDCAALLAMDVEKTCAL